MYIISSIPNMFMHVQGVLGEYRNVKLWEFSTYRAVVKVFVILVKLLNIAKKRPFDTSGVITHNRFVEGERLMWKYMQRENFQVELSRLECGIPVDTGPFAQLKLYLDKYGIIRCHGRLPDASFSDVNKPVLFPYRHPLTLLFIQQNHRCINCSGVTHTLNRVRRDIHSLKLRRQIREILNKCLVCQKLLGRPFRHPDNPPLDVYRIRSSRPFTTCGCDYIGPFFVKPRVGAPWEETNIHKIWIVLFTCLVTRAICLIIVPDRTTVTFLRAL